MWNRRDSWRCSSHCSRKRRTRSARGQAKSKTRSSSLHFLFSPTAFAAQSVASYLLAQCWLVKLDKFRECLAVCTSRAVYEKAVNERESETEQIQTQLHAEQMKRYINSY